MWDNPETCPSGCADCDYFKHKHYVMGIGPKEGVPVDYFVIAESPFLVGVSPDTTKHVGWTLDTEGWVKDVFTAAKSKHREFAGLTGLYTYAVHCCEDKPKMKVVQSCKKILQQEILSHLHKDKAAVVFALGATVLRSFGVKFGKYREIRAKLIEVNLGGRRVIIFPSLSKKELAVKSGYLNVLKNHAEIFLRAALDVHDGQVVNLEVPIQELTKGYVIPKTLEEVDKVTQLIVDYSANNTPEDHMISVDTETNTLFPHRNKLKLLSVIFGWDKGKATSIPVEHPDCSWTLEEVKPFINRVLHSRKPKVFHNGKFDIKVLLKKGFEIRRLAWDTMCGEHLLCEDKKGFYGLKNITKEFLPKYAGYEDQLDSYKTEEVTLTKELKKESEKLRGAAKKLAADKGFEYIPLDVLNLYGALDGDVTWQIARMQRARIEQEDILLAKTRKYKASNNEYYQRILAPRCSLSSPLNALMRSRIIPTTKVLADMELHGIAVDSDYLIDLSTNMNQSIRKAKQQLEGMLSEHRTEAFNPSSAAHLRTVLFTTGYKHPETNQIICHKGYVDPQYTETGLISTNAPFLRLLVNQYNCEFSKIVLRYRAMEKARSTFVENILNLSREDNRLHAQFHINGTATGRLSSSDENMQNIPSFIGEHNLKKIFIPTDPDYAFVNVDAKAAEVRVYAAYSKDTNLIKALNEGMDPHSFFASMVFKPETILKNIPKEQHSFILNTIGIDIEHAWSYDDFCNADAIKKQDFAYGKQLSKLRKIIKQVVFGILYGAAPRKISSIVGIPDDQAAAIINTLFTMFPTIQQYINQTKDIIRHVGVVDTFFGRRRRLDTANLSGYLKGKAFRQGVNFLIQSTSSEIVTGVLCDVANPLKSDFGGQLLLTVHDSIGFQVPKKYVSQIPDFIKKYGIEKIGSMYSWLPVPFHWDIGVGPSYGELQSISSYLKQDTMSSLNKEDDYIEMEIREDLQIAANN
jgi:DNA polymerase I-like protein with 3'-5' exonuclease and polymerase domains